MTDVRCSVCGAPARYVAVDVRAPAEPLAAYCPQHSPFDLFPRRPDSLARQLVRSQLE